MGLSLPEIAAAVLALVASLFGAGKKVEELNEGVAKADANESDIEELAEDVNDVKHELQSVRNSVERTESKVDRVGDTVDDLSKTVQDHQSEMLSATTELLRRERDNHASKHDYDQPDSRPDGGRSMDSD